MAQQNFIKIKENFTCAHCGTKVIGTGYTNHCPECLYSKHVDDRLPGDRASTCQSLMKPISTMIKAGKFILFHQCLKCQKTTKNKASANDNQEKLIQLSTNPVKTK